MNYISKISFTIALAVGICTAGWSQIAMTRTTFTAAYTPIATATGATASTASGDDAVQTAIPIGFTFNYLGTNYTDCGATTNGALGFVGMTNTRFNTDLYTTTAPNAILAPWWDDLTSPAGTMLYQTQGTPGSQTFTMQWSALSFYTGSTATVNFQIILYEGTNVIEYCYGAQPTGTFNTASESASIGMKSQTGGNGQYLDAVTGSAFTGNAMLTAQTMWPSRHFRFTPGLPAVLAGGIYTVGNAGMYPSVSEAIADVNHRGISGAVTLSLLDANNDITVANGRNFFPMLIGPVAGSSAVNTISIAPASGTSTITSPGAGAGQCTNQATATAIATGNEPILALVGGRYITVSNINLVASSVAVDRGLAVLNSSATVGSQFNAFMNISATLNRTNTATIGIEQRVPTTPTGVSGANSNNAYMNLNISNTYVGIHLNGNAAFPDLGCAIGNTSPTAWNSIGSATANDIGNGTTTVYGIRCTSQSGVSVYNNEVRNLTVTGGATCDGIFMELTQGASGVYNNIIHDLRNTSTTATNNIQGIRANVATTAGHNLRVYNNFIYGFTSSYAGAASATRQYKGIYAQSGGGGVVASSIEIDNNNIYIDGSSSPNISSTCFEIGTTSGIVINVRNNNFYNATGAQTAPAGHFTWVSTSATLTGNTGSVSNFNNLYVSNTTQGFVGRGNATDYATLANWQTAMTQDANSLSTDPGYTSTVNLHVSTPALNGAAMPLAWVTVDIDNQARAVTPDIGADEFTPSTLDLGATLLVTPAAGGCYSSTETVTIRVRNFATVSHDFSVNPATVTVNITGAVVATLNATINSGTLASATTGDFVIGTFNMSAAGTYTFNSFTTLTGDQNNTNDAMVQSVINYQPGTITVNPASVCQGSTTTLTLSGNTSTSIQWEESTDGGVTWNPIVGATTSPYVATPTDTTWYRSLMCGSLASTVDTVIFNPVVAPVTVNDTVCGLDSATLTASGNGTLYWYTTPSGGTSFYSGTSYTVSVASTTTYYVESSSGGGIQSVGLATNVAGGGQQTSTAYNIFDVTQSCTLLGAYVYPGAAGNVVCDLRDNTGALITTRTVAVTAADINQRTYIALNIPLTPGTGYRLAQGTGSVSMYRNSAGVAYPYTLPGVLSITGSSAGGSFYYFFYDWQVLTGCTSPRTAVTAEVLSTAPVTLSASTSTICAGDSATLIASSANQNYIYTWSPAGSLSSPTGDSVMASPSAATSYIVVADSAGCIARDTITLGVNALPSVVVTLQDTLICIGETDSLFIDNALANPYYTSAPNMPILDPPAVAQRDTINVPASFLLGPNSIVSLCLNINHTWDGDMVITLISPSGTTLDLSSGNGGSGDNMIGTCFMMSAATNITAGVAPFTGNFIPEGAGGFNVFNGENAQGDWQITIQDVAGGDVGTLLDWSIQFAPVNYGYSWVSVPVGFTSTSDTIEVAPAVTTQYIVTVLDSATGCTNQYSHTVVVNDSISLTVTNDSLICAGDSIVLSVTAAGGDGNYSYSWSNGVITALDSVSPSANTVYVITVADGCTTPTVMDSVSVTLATPLVIASISGDTTLCSSSPLVLMVNTTGGDGNTSYAWSNGPTTAVDSVTSGAPGSSMTYVVTVNEGCGTSAVDSVMVTSIAAPVATVMTADTTVCSGDTVVAMGMGTSGDGNYSYSWSNGPVTALDSIVAMASATYTLTVTDGCGNTAVDSVAVNTFGMPTVTASNDTAVCYPNYAYLNSTAGGGDGNYSYAWTSGATTSSDSVALFGTMMQYITVTDGCGNSSMDSVLVTVNMSPTAAFTESTAGSVVSFTDASVNATSWSWNFGDSQTSTQQNPSHTYAANGSYTVTLIVSNSCGSDTITSVVLIDVGINDPAVFNGVNIYPNPSSEVFNVNFAMAIGGRVSIELFDVQGKLVSAQNMQNVASGQIVTIDVASVESGLYMMKITGENASQVYKLNVQH